MSNGFTIHEYEGDLRETDRIIKIMEMVGWGRYLGTAEDWANAFKESRELSGRRIYLAKKGLLVIGFIELLTKPSRSFHFGENTAYVYQMAIDPKHSRGGIMRDFSIEVLDRLYQSGFAAVVADIRWNNVASLALSTSVGMSLVGPSPERVQVNAGGDPHLRVQCMLTARPEIAA